MVNALRDGFRAAGDGDRALRGIGEHLGGHLDGGPGDLTDLLDLGATLADERAALRGWHDQAKGDGWFRHCSRRHQVCQVLSKSPQWITISCP